MGQCGLHVHFCSTCLGINTAWGIAAVWGGTSVFSTFTEGAAVGITGRPALASNSFLEVGMVLGQGMSCLTWKVGALGIASSCGGLEL